MTKKHRENDINVSTWYTMILNTAVAVIYKLYRELYFGKHIPKSPETYNISHQKRFILVSTWTYYYICCNTRNVLVCPETNEFLKSTEMRKHFGILPFVNSC